jgi:hypothetical protein
MTITVAKAIRIAVVCALTVLASSVAFSQRAQAAELPGATAGEIGVSTSGASTYAVPIAVQPGTTGLQPKLTLQYDSLAGNGPAGMGWTIGGVAVIARCPTSLTIDGNFIGAPGIDPRHRSQIR